MSKRYTLSVTVITLNEADRIGRCLDSVKNLADEIIVLDSGSTDRTVDVAKRYTDKVRVTDWPGYGKQKQRALAEASGDWVLAIDADEALDATLQKSLEEFLSRDRGDVVAAKMVWANIVFGKRLNYGRSSRAQLKLVWRDGAYFTDDDVHESLRFGPGQVVTLEGRLQHETHRDYGHSMRKNAEYAWLGSQMKFRRGERCNSLTVGLVRALWAFFRDYVLYRGFLDGRVGFLSAVNLCHYSFDKYAGLWTLTRAEKLEQRDEAA